MTRIDTLTERIRHPYVGMYVPTVTLPAVTGDPVLLGGPPGGHVQVLFVFSTSCQYCKASLPAWKQIAAELAASEGAEVIGVSIDSVETTRRYLKENGIELPVVSLTDQRLRALYRAGITPQMLIVDARGRVSYARIGALTDGAAVDSVVDAARDPFQLLIKRVRE
ncbi:MAG: TlpA family protein disulfide reductase [Gemmatimonadota bacterium]|nr:MAG: TlpA family protein disulfide reductase [Gemmatimonadota bacterium]